MIKQNVLDSMCLVFKKAKKSGLKKELFKELNSDLSVISESFDISIKQAFIYAVIYNMHNISGVVFTYQLADYFSSNFTRLKPLLTEVNKLIKSGMIFQYDHNSLVEKKPGHIYVDNYIYKNIDIERNDKNTSKTFKDLQDYIEIVKRDAKDWSYKDLFSYTTSFIRKRANENIFGITAPEDCLSPFEQCVFLWLVWHSLKGEKYFHVNTLLSMIFQRRTDLHLLYFNKVVSKEFSRGFCLLVLVSKIRNFEHENPEYFFNLTPLAYSLLKTQGIEILTELYEDDDQENLDSLNGTSNFKFPDTMKLITPKSLGEKKLIFSEEQGKDLKVLEELFMEEKFKKVQEALDNQATTKGVLVMLYGSPGTGKTESVYQIAKKSNRAIIKVEVSQLYGAFWGESEKSLKEVFDTYRSYCRINEDNLKPILLFNEADGVFASRLTNIQRSIDKSQNVLMNILLEELEIFDGILFATTNLVGNLDPAFERRFLYKIEIRKPDVKTRAEIIKLRLNFLSPNDCLKLAEKFSLSGGQIENIFRKVTLNSLLNSKQVTLSEIEALCMQEYFEREDAYSSNRQKVIGYKTS